MTGLKDQCFGVEVEMTGITRKQAAQALADYFGTIPKAKGGVYDTWKVKDPTGKEWKLVSDASIIGEQWTGTEYLENDIKDFRVELVTPKLTYPELPKLQECMRRLKQIGAKVNDSCGIHVHVDAANHNRQSLKNLISIMYSKEDLLFKALQVNEVRAIRFCKKVLRIAKDSYSGSQQPPHINLFGYRNSIDDQLKKNLHFGAYPAIRKIEEDIHLLF